LEEVALWGYPVLYFCSRCPGYGVGKFTGRVEGVLLTTFHVQSFQAEAIKLALNISKGQHGGDFSRRFFLIPEVVMHQFLFP